MTFRPRLAIDMDEVMADAHGALARWQAEANGYDFSESQLARSSVKALVSVEHAEEMERLLEVGAIFGQFAPMEGSQEAVKRLADRFDIFIVTAAMEYPASCAFKFAWLAEHFPFVSSSNIVFCGDKSIVAADLLLDDSERHFERFGGQGVLFAAPHNSSSSWPVKVGGWADAVAYLEAWPIAGA